MITAPAADRRDRPAPARAEALIAVAASAGWSALADAWRDIARDLRF